MLKNETTFVGFGQVELYLWLVYYPYPLSHAISTALNTTLFFVKKTLMVTLYSLGTCLKISLAS